MALHATSLLALPVLLIGMTACGNAYADRAPAGPRHGAALVPAPSDAPYTLDIIDENGSFLDAYQHRGRVYVLGSAGQRYTLRVGNPTPRRIEAVVSVDGLDVIDGEPADLRKRGYVVPPYGEVRVEGFRVSTDQVAAFRFSSVRSSYAGRKGKARNVGVIGVAIFEEQTEPQIVLPSPPPRPPVPYGRYRGDVGSARGEAAPAPHTARKQSAPDADASAPSQPTRSAPPRSAASRAPASAGSRGADTTAPSGGAMLRDGVAAEAESRQCCGPRPSERPGLGTEFGERRYSSVSWTRFVRAHAHRADVLIELRYNDLAGLQALGIPIVDTDEVLTRETATPFPGDQRFAQPPR